MSISFGFKKKVESKVVATEKPVIEERDYLKTVEERVLKSQKQKAEPKDLVIPLIRKNRYINAVKNVQKNNRTSDDKNQALDDIQSEAVKEIIEESKHFMENVESKNGDGFDDLAVPLLLKNKVPDGFETDERLDVSLRPNESTEADYNQIPIEAFGMAVLRGMGWNPEEGIGRTFKRNTKMLEQQVRPKGLGLGADVPAAMKTDIGDAPVLQNRKDVEDVLALNKGAYVFIHTGGCKNKYGTVQGIDIDTSRCIIKLAIGGKFEQIGQHYLRVVSRREYEKNAKDLSRLSKAYTGPDQSLIGNGSRHKEVASDSSRKRSKDRNERINKHTNASKNERSDERMSDEPKSKCRKHKNVETHSYEQHKDKKHKTHKSHHKRNESHKKKRNLPTLTWVRPQMRVRIIDKSYKKGRYYKDKVIVEDVMAKGMCSCKTEDGKILDDIHDSMLETVIPRSTSDAYVIIVQAQAGSKNDGKLAKILEKDKDKCEAMLQLIEDRDVVLKVPFEELCEFTGDAEAHTMF